MSREWKPGDVALVEAGCWANRKVAVRLAEGWAHANGVNLDEDGVILNPRPLVVIDPENAEQVTALAGALAENGWRPGALYVCRDALRSLLTPPKPDEPQGLGAVVEDADGDAWVRDRDANPGYLGIEWLNVRTRAHCAYAFIAAVRVLSEGVTA